MLRLPAFNSSSLLVPDNGDGEGSTLGDVGEIPLGVCEAEGPFESAIEPLSEIFVSEALRVNLLPGMPVSKLSVSNDQEW